MERTRSPEIAEAWQEAHRPSQDRRTGDWAGWSPKTAKRVADNFRCCLRPALGRRMAQQVSGVELDRLSATVVIRRHGRARPMFDWAVRKKRVVSNPALSADPPKIKPRPLAIADMSALRRCRGRRPPDFGTYVQLAAQGGQPSKIIGNARVRCRAWCSPRWV